MNETAKTWPGELIFLHLKRATPENKQKWIDEFNKLLQFNTESVQEWKHTSGYNCPKCGLEGNVVCNGKMNSGSSRQRYLCHTCGTSFNDHTNSVFHRSKKVDRWPVFMKAMLDGMTIRQIAKEVGISPATAHSWRKKILNYIAEHWSPQLSGIVEYTEHTVKSSRKGQKTGEEPASEHQETIIFCRSRSGDVCVARGKEWGQRDSVINKDIKWHFTSSATSNYMPKWDYRNLSSAERRLLHSNHVDPIAIRFKEEYAKMRGVADKYLHQYAVWHQYMIELEGIPGGMKVDKLLRRCL